VTIDAKIGPCGAESGAGPSALRPSGPAYHSGLAAPTGNLGDGEQAPAGVTGAARPASPATLSYSGEQHKEHQS
jgi:hypothetical protein